MLRRPYIVESKPQFQSELWPHLPSIWAWDIFLLPLLLLPPSPEQEKEASPRDCQEHHYRPPPSPWSSQNHCWASGVDFLSKSRDCNQRHCCPRGPFMWSCHGVAPRVDRCSQRSELGSNDSDHVLRCFQLILRQQMSSSIILQKDSRFFVRFLFQFCKARQGCRVSIGINILCSVFAVHDPKLKGAGTTLQYICLQLYPWPLSHFLIAMGHVSVQNWSFISDNNIDQSIDSIEMVWLIMQHLFWFGW